MWSLNRLFPGRPSLLMGRLGADTAIGDGQNRMDNLLKLTSSASWPRQPNRSRKKRQGHYGKDSKGRPHAGHP